MPQGREGLPSERRLLAEKSRNEIRPQLHQSSLCNHLHAT